VEGNTGCHLTRVPPTSSPRSLALRRVVGFTYEAVVAIVSVPPTLVGAKPGRCRGVRVVHAALIYDRPTPTPCWLPIPAAVQVQVAAALIVGEPARDALAGERDEIVDWHHVDADGPVFCQAGQ